jgi:NAD(P)-dependent dehydrogenase (short-subunit alcohol dehydrogenase family)
MNLKLENKTAFISGSTQGIGYAIAHALLTEGAHVILNGRSQEKVDAAVKRLNHDGLKGEASGIAADFDSAEAVASLISQLPEIDILINNVGIFEIKEFAEITDADWQRFFEVNVMSGVRLSRTILPGMLKKKWGRIIFISSESAINIPGNMIHYGFTKTAMLSVSRGLAQLTKNTEVTVNTLIIGPTYSDGVAQTVEQIAVSQQQSAADLQGHLINNIYPTSLLNRFLKTEEVADLVAFIASPLSIATNGAAVRADGGVLNTIF